MPVDTKLNNVIVNTLTTAKYNELLQEDKIKDDEFYLTTDVTYPTEQQMNSALSDKQDSLTPGSNIRIVNNVISTSATTLYKVKNIVVPISDFVSDLRYNGFKYRADISVAGVNVNHFPTVVFSIEDCISENYSSFVESGNGYVSIWAKELPDSALTIPLITYE